jgi:hypothetical protein
MAAVYAVLVARTEAADTWPLLVLLLLSEVAYIAWALERIALTRELLSIVRVHARSAAVSSPVPSTSETTTKGRSTARASKRRTEWQQMARELASELGIPARADISPKNVEDEPY